MNTESQGKKQNLVQDLSQTLSTPVPEFFYKQLEQVYIRINEDVKHIIVIRNWCITAWLAIFTVSNSASLKLSIVQKIVLPLLPIVFFWLVEGVQRTWLRFHSRLAQKLEVTIAEGVYDSTNIRDYLFVSSESSLGRNQFLKRLMSSLGSKSATLFYGLLLVATAIVQYLFRY